MQQVVNDINTVERKNVQKRHDAYPLASTFLKTLTYFDIFFYPLSETEIYRFSELKNIDVNEGRQTLRYLLNKGIIGKKGNLYYLGTSENKTNRRIKGNKLAKKRMKQAFIYSRLIASFPFVRGVYISGSLSKGYMEAHSDIDYFIITEKNRLWLSRTFLILFKKIFLFNSHKNFCVNYFVDTESLKLKEQNVYTATEVAMLIPMYNNKLHQKFLIENQWYQNYYPNYIPPVTYEVKSLKLLKKVVEKILDNKFGNFLDNLLYRGTLWFWQNKHKVKDLNKFSDILLSKKVSRYNPNNYQTNVLNKYHEKLETLEIKTGIIIGEA